MLKSFFLLIGVVCLTFILAIFVTRFIGFRIQRPYPEHQFKKELFEVIAHRGGALERPENTLMAFDHALKLSPRIILEADVHLTKDLHLVVIHDETVDRTTDGTGVVRDFTLEDLQQLDAGYGYKDEEGHHPYRGQGIVVPSLREVLLRYPQQRIVLDLKVVSKEMVQGLIDLIENLGNFERLLIASRNPQLIEQIRLRSPDWIFAGTSTQIYQSIIFLSMFLEPIDPIKADVYYIPEVNEGITLLSKRLLGEMHRRGKSVLIWTINEEEDMKRLIAFDVDGIVTDRPSKLLQILKDQNISH